MRRIQTGNKQRETRTLHDVHNREIAGGLHGLKVHINSVVTGGEELNQNHPARILHTNIAYLHDHHVVLGAHMKSAK